MYTDDKQYVSMRLENTVVRDKRKGRLVHVLKIRILKNILWAIVCKIDGLEEDKYRTPLDNLDLSSPPLGNVDLNNITYFITRVPKRNDWRQGLRRDNLGYVYEGRHYNFDLPSLKVLKTPIYNMYKPYKIGRAFSRNFSVDKKGCLWYKCREIVGKDVEGSPVLNEKYEWLKEALEDALER